MFTLLFRLWLIGVDVLEGGWLAADDAVYMNCSVLDFESFMFCPQKPPVRVVRDVEATYYAYLCPHLQHILERHTGRRQLALESHDNIFVVFFQQLSFH